jgi:hypothetical protein
MTNHPTDTPPNLFETSFSPTPPPTQPSTPKAIPQPTKGGHAYVLALVVCVLVWVLWTSFWDSGLYGDNVEQFIWSHSLEWGYHKHPPLPTWLLVSAISLIGPAWWLTHALAAICVAATGVFTWLIARRLAGQNVANTTAVLWGLQQCFSVSAEIYNHNTVLVLCLAATTFCLIRALEPSPRVAWRWWLAIGALAACAMLSKYQAALPLAALGIAVLVIANKRRLAVVWPAALALGIFVFVLAPHLYWGYTHQFPQLRYASEIVDSGGFFRRLFWQLTFAVNQIRMNLPLISALMISWVMASMWRKQHGTSATVKRSSAHPQELVRVWMFALLWGPIAVVLSLSFVTGSPLRNHWGVQLFQFLPLWIAVCWQHRKFLQPQMLVMAALVVHGLGLTYYAFKQNNPEAVLAARRADSAYPAQKMSDAALAYWNSATSCPLKIVVGDFEAGLVSAFSKDFPAVFTAESATPWLTQADLQNYGALYVFDSATTLPKEALMKTNWTMATAKDGTKKYLQFAVRLPRTACK